MGNVGILKRSHDVKDAIHGHDVTQERVAKALTLRCTPVTYNIVTT